MPDAAVVPRGRRGWFWKEEMAKPPEGPPRDAPPVRDEAGPRDAAPRDTAPRQRDWYAGRSGSRVSVEIQPTGGRDRFGGGGRFGDRGFGEDRGMRAGPSRFGDRPPREGGGGRPPRDSGPPIDWDKWEADLEAALKARNGEG
jgi:hypothetical protein